MNFTIASTLDEALAAVASGARPIAGGSDLVVGARHGKSPMPDSVVAIDRIDSLGNIEPSTAGVRIGALVTHARLEIDAGIVADYTALAD
ncbi:MAG TPA: FAD binding domain-containing protein, partial [Ilumatobacteraceae bacterium]|nr:FAD binding domain-containing protein [Ilumatobacteraceae bacterium]